jgi:hypothetical protein
VQAVEGVGQRPPIAEAARDLDRFAAHRHPLRRWRGVAQGAAAEAREEARAQLAVLVGKRGKRLFEQRDEAGVAQARAQTNRPP